VGIYSQKKYGIPYVLNVQDLFPEEAIQMGILKSRLAIRYFENMEKKAYKNASAIVVHSERNARYIKQVEPNKETFVIENWVDENRITPGPRINKFSIQHGLIDKFVVSFAGTIGFAQDVKSIIESAVLLREYKNIVFIIVGNGARKKEAENLVEKYGLNNVKLLPPVPPDEYPLVLHSSDVSLATLIKDLRTPVVPSKIVSIMSAGIPVIASLDLNSDAHQLIRRAKCGFSYPPERSELIKEAILTLYKNPDLKIKLGENGRKYVVENLSVRIAAKKFLEIFKSSLNKEGPEHGRL
jgi:glycosyltransferase involved in cell wall biosynthesis